MEVDTTARTAELRKNSAEVIRVAPVVYHGHDLLDVRVYRPGLLPGDEDRPTKKGLSLPPALWQQLLPLITQALED